MKYFEIFLLELMATNFIPSSGSYVSNKFPSISQWSDTGPSWPSCFFFCVKIFYNGDWYQSRPFRDLLFQADSASYRRNKTSIPSNNRPNDKVELSIFDINLKVVEKCRPISAFAVDMDRYFFAWTVNTLFTEHGSWISSKQALVFTCLQYKSFENTVEKGEIALYEQFLLFPQCFRPFYRTVCVFIKF